MLKLGKISQVLILAALAILLISALSFPFVSRPTMAANNPLNANTLTTSASNGVSNVSSTSASGAATPASGNGSVVHVTSTPSTGTSSQSSTSTSTSSTPTSTTTQSSTSTNSSSTTSGTTTSTTTQSSTNTSSSSTPSGTTGVMIPLYSYPGSDWDLVVQAKLANPSVPMVAIINPSNGPGASKDLNYVLGIDKLRAAGITVLGYVHTSYAARSTTDVMADVNSYKAWYAVNGIFFDEMSNVAGNEAYYTALSAYAKSMGFSFTVGNPGASVPSSYVGTVDCIVVYESQGLPSSSSLAAWTMGMAKGNFAMMAYGVGQLSGSSMSGLSTSVAYVYVTDSSLPNPYGALPGYFGSLVASLTNA